MPSFIFTFLSTIPYIECLNSRSNLYLPRKRLPIIHLDKLLNGHHIKTMVGMFPIYFIYELISIILLFILYRTIITLVVYKSELPLIVPLFFMFIPIIVPLSGYVVQTMLSLVVTLVFQMVGMPFKPEHHQKFIS